LREMRIMNNTCTASLVGIEFGRLTVTGLDHRKNSFNYWECQCSCGKVRVVRGDSLSKGSTRSCGCLTVDMAIKTHTKHDKWGTRIYMIWNGMKQRCENEKDKAYKNYGARGIGFCDEWSDFNNFYNWSMDNGYVDDLSIDRIDNNGNYEPKNCRWATFAIQARNKRGNRFITHGGETMCWKDWESKLNLSRGLIRNRLLRGWSEEQALTTNVSQ